MTLAKTAIALPFALLLTSTPSSVYSARDKAYYAGADTVNFVRPGLVISIQSASIAADGTIKTRFKLTDPRGLPLDRLGVTTPGTVGVSFIAAVLPANETQYVAYTTRRQTSPTNNQSATQASSDTGGTYTTIAEGEYEYTFGTKAPSTIDRSATHTIGIYGSRSLTEFDLGTQRDDATFNFVPGGGAVTKVRDVVRTNTCNRCHDPLGLHGGNRRSVELCVLCHTPQTVDPDTGNTQDLPVLIHKIHMGSGLPSVQAGGKYVIIGNANSVHDYSKVVMPSDARRCGVCHESEATQKDRVFTPTRAACGACHDDVNFATGAGHRDLPQVSDSQCTRCHTPDGELEFDASIMGAHTVPTHSRVLPGTVFELIKVDDGAAGKKPTVTFSIKDKAGNPILPSDMTRLALVLAGPTSDYKTVISEDVRQAQGSAGVYFWTFAASIPADAKGSFSVGIEGYRNQTLLPGTAKEQVVRDAGANKVTHFALDGGRATARRQIVSTAKCNACHASLELHGGNRNAVEQCVLCHNPSADDAARRPATDGKPETIDMRTMVHRIHSGEELTTPYAVYGFGNTKHDYSGVVYVGDRRNCDACHVNNSQQLPLEDNLDPVITQRGPLEKVGPATAACTSCHDSRSAMSHALANTTSLGESCASCHGPNADFSVNRVHAR